MEMKNIEKIIISVILLIFMCSSVFADSGNNIFSKMKNTFDERTEIINQNYNKMPLKSSCNLTGFDKVMIHARNQTRLQHIESVMQKIQNKSRDRLSNLEDLEISEECEKENIECSIIAKGKSNAKFMWVFNMKRSLSYKVTNIGEIEPQKKWSDIFWKIEG